MRKLGLGILFSLIIAVLVAGVAFALPPDQLPSDQGTDQAKESSPIIAEDGRVVAPPQDMPFPQPAENQLKKIVFIRYAPKKPGAKPEGGRECGNGICEKGENWRKCPQDCLPPEPTPTPTPTPTTTPTQSDCYGFLSGARPHWNWVENFYYANGLGSVANWATQEWNGLTSATIFGSAISGSYTWGDYDQRNAISFGDYSDPNVIAVTAIWYLGGNIYEYDIMFDYDYYPNGQELFYDLETVTLHEFGHAAGLDDLYNSPCSQEVMYGYYMGPKTDFGNGDITGIHTLYSP